jgi:hypothetical protein
LAYTCAFFQPAGQAFQTILANSAGIRANLFIIRQKKCGKWMKHTKQQQIYEGKNTLCLKYW